MIELIIRIALAIATSSGCQMGKPVEYYGWVEAHPDYTVPMQLSVESGDWWLMCDGVEDCNLFHFAEPIETTIATGASHGDCFVSVNTE